MGYLTKSSVWVEIAAPVLLVGLVFNLVAFSTVGWSRLEARGVANDYGLWLLCTRVDGGKAECRAVTLYNDIPAWYKASQAMMSLGLICMLAAVALLAVYILVPKLSKNAAIAFSGCLMCVLSALFMIIGVIVYGNKMTEWMRSIWTPPDGSGVAALSYSFVLAVMAMLMAIVSGCLYVMDIRDADYFLSYV